MLVVLHDVLNDLIFGSNNELAKRNRSDKLAFIVHTVAGVDRLLVESGFSYHFYRLFNGVGLRERNHLDSHDASCRIFGILKEFVNKLSRVRLCVGKHTGYNVCRNLLKEVNRIVKEHVLHKEFKLGICDCVNDITLNIAGQIRKSISR